RELMSSLFTNLSDAPATLVELLRWRAAHQPDQRAYTFLVDGESQEVHLTYQELDRQARAIGVLLASVATPGGRALLLYPPGLDYIAAFFGCLYAGIVAVPPIHPTRHYWSGPSRACGRSRSMRTHGSRSQRHRSR